MLGNTVMYIAFGVFCAAFVFCIMMLAGGQRLIRTRVLPAIEQVKAAGGLMLLVMTARPWASCRFIR